MIQTPWLARRLRVHLCCHQLPGCPFISLLLGLDWIKNISPGKQKKGCGLKAIVIFIIDF